MKDKVMKSILVGVVSVILCCFAIGINAEAHTHVYTKDYTTVSSSLGDSHSYVSGYKVDSYGNIYSVEYGTCQTIVYMNIAHYSCKCGKTRSEADGPATVKHIHCGR